MYMYSVPYVSTGEMVYVGDKNETHLFVQYISSVFDFVG